MWRDKIKITNLTLPGRNPHCWRQAGYKRKKEMKHCLNSFQSYKPKTFYFFHTRLKQNNNIKKLYPVFFKSRIGFILHSGDRKLTSTNHSWGAGEFFFWSGTSLKSLHWVPKSSRVTPSTYQHGGKNYLFSRRALSLPQRSSADKMAGDSINTEKQQDSQGLWLYLKYNWVA